MAISVERWVLGVLAVVVGSAAHSIVSAQEDGSNEATLPPEMLQLREGYAEAIEKAAEPIRRLRDSYAMRLKELKAEFQASGELDSTLEVQEEIERVAENGARPGRRSGLDELAELQEIYHDHAAQRAPGVNREKASIEVAYLDSLDEQIAAQTQKGNLSVAVRLKDLRDTAEKRLAKWKRLAASYSDDYDPFDYLDWERLGEIIEAGHLTPSERVGGETPDKDKTPDVPDEPSVLVGFDLYLSPFHDSDSTVRKIVPLWRSESAEITEGIPRARARGEQRRRVLAKDGYVVSGITAHSHGAGLRKIQLTFSRLDGMRLDEDDSYETDFYGEWEGGRVTSLSTNGKLPVGIDGWVGLGTPEFWLVLADPPLKP